MSMCVMKGEGQNLYLLHFGHFHETNYFRIYSGYGEQLVVMVPKLARAENVSSLFKIIEKESDLSLKSALLQVTRHISTTC